MTCPRLVAGREDVHAAAMVTTGEGRTGAGAEMAGYDATTDKIIALRSERILIAVSVAKEVPDTARSCAWGTSRWRRQTNKH